MGAITLDLSKQDAARRVAALTADERFATFGGYEHNTFDLIDSMLEMTGKLTNRAIDTTPASSAFKSHYRAVESSGRKLLPNATYLNKIIPPCFGSIYEDIDSFGPEWGTYVIEGGYVLMLPEAVAIFDKEKN